MTTARSFNYCLVIIILLCLGSAQAANQDFSIKLRTGAFAPDQMQLSSLSGPNLTGKHVIVQLNGPITDDRKDQLEQAGINLQGYIPNYAFVSYCEETPDTRQLEELGVRWLGVITPDLKVAPELMESGFRDYAARYAGQCFGSFLR